MYSRLSGGPVVALLVMELPSALVSGSLWFSGATPCIDGSSAGQMPDAWMPPCIMTSSVRTLTRDTEVGSFVFIESSPNSRIIGGTDELRESLSYGSSSNVRVTFTLSNISPLIPRTDAESDREHHIVRGSMLRLQQSIPEHRAGFPSP